MASASFESNRGQAAGSARFLVRRANGAALVAPDALGVVMREPGSRRGVALAFRFVGARPTAALDGERLLPGTVNYLIGSDSRRWRTDVPTYAAVRCRDVYPGVDVVYYGNGADLEYDFAVSPGADLSAIRLAVEGAKRAYVDAKSGDLVIQTALGDLRQRAPVLYQETETGRRFVAGRYAERGAAIGIEASGYDPRLPLVVDPVLRYSTYLGGGAAEALNAVVADAAGNAYVVGNTASTDYPATPGAFQTDQPADDVVVTKLNATGNAPAFSTYLGGDMGDFGNGVAIDPSGNVYVSGTTFSTNFPSTNGFATDQPNADAFLTKLNPTGTGVLYSTYIGGNDVDGGSNVVVDADGTAYLTGATHSTNFPVTASAFQSMLGAGGSSAFVTRVNTAATGAASLVYSTYLGDSAEGKVIATDGQKRVYVAGQADGTAFPTTVGAFQGDQPGRDGFVSKLDTNASGAASLVYSTYLGGDLEDICFGIAVNAAGNAYVSGVTMSSNFPTTAGGFQTAPPNVMPFDTDAFVVELNTGGTGLVYGSYLGGTDDDEALALALDSSDGVYVSGDTYSANFPTTSGAISGDLPDQDAFVSRLDTTRSGAASLVSSTYLGGNGFEQATDVAPNASGEAYVVGFTASTNFPTVNAFQTDQTVIDAFVTKLSLDAGATGSDTVAVYAASTGAFFLKNANGSGPADSVFSFGAGGSLVPLAGDWNGDGVTTVGVYDPGTGAFFLKNTNGGGGADIVFTFGGGGAGVVPLVGDWNGDGTDTIGLYVMSTGAFFLRNSNSSGPADIVFTFGPGGGNIVTIIGDWNGDGIDSAGIYNTLTGAFFLRNSNSNGPADIAFSFGVGGATPIAGDFDNDGTDTIGLFISGSSTWFLRNTNSSGSADLAFTYGPSGLIPLLGDWNGA